MSDAEAISKERAIKRGPGMRAVMGFSLRVAAPLRFAPIGKTSDLQRVQNHNNFIVKSLKGRDKDRFHRNNSLIIFNLIKRRRYGVYFSGGIYFSGEKSV